MAKAYPYLNAKHRDPQTNQCKKAAYKAIAAAVSAVGVTRWTADKCQKKIQVLTSEAKSMAAEWEKNMQRTGGRPQPAPLTVAQSNALDLVPVVNYTGVSGGLDSSASVIDAQHISSSTMMFNTSTTLSGAAAHNAASASHDFAATEVSFTFLENATAPGSSIQEDIQGVSIKFQDFGH